MAYTRIAMLSEQLHSIEAFGELSIYILMVASLSRDDLLRQTSKLNFCRHRTPLLTRRIPFFLPQPDLKSHRNEIDSITPPTTTSSNLLSRRRCPTCSADFVRPQDRERHLLSHLPSWIYCPFPLCTWTGYRVDALRRHWPHHNHHDPDNHILKREAFEIYNAPEFVDQIIAGTMTTDVAVDKALELVRAKALQLQRPSLLTNLMRKKLLAGSSSEGSLPGDEPSEPSSSLDDRH